MWKIDKKKKRYRPEGCRSDTNHPKLKINKYKNVFFFRNLGSLNLWNQSTGSSCSHRPATAAAAAAAAAALACFTQSRRGGGKESVRGFVESSTVIRRRRRRRRLPLNTNKSDVDIKAYSTLSVPLPTSL